MDLKIFALRCLESHLLWWLNAHSPHMCPGPAAIWEEGQHQFPVQTLDLQTQYHISMQTQPFPT